MELEKLKQFKEFINCYDIVGKAYNLCENNDYCYLRHDGIGTYNINECLDMIEKNGSIETIEKQYNCESYTINSDIKEWY